MARNEILAFRLTAAERARLEALARGANLPVTVFCRKIVLDMADRRENTPAQGREVVR